MTIDCRVAALLAALAIACGVEDPNGSSSPTDSTATDSTSATTTTAGTEDSGGDGDGTTGDGDGQPMLPEPTVCPDPIPTADAPGAPVLCGIEFASETSLRLQFTEPVTVAPGFDPSRFRLSTAVAYPGYASYPAQTQYWDPMEHFCSNTDACFGPMTATAVDGLPEPGAVLVTFDQFSYYECGIIENFNLYLASALMLHFAPEGASIITDAGGVAAAPLAPFFVDEPEIVAFRDGVFPDADPYVAIACPVPTPPP